MRDRFINPYTFVPLPECEPQRSAPHGHLGNGQLLSGKLEVEITAVTPILLRGFTNQNGSEPEVAQLPQRPDGRKFLPGSAMKGSWRSLHETLTGSCFRVFDADFIPTYRDTPQRTHQGQLRMAVVTEHTEPGKPPLLQLCRSGNLNKDRVHQKYLRKLNDSGNLTSGDRFRIDKRDAKGRPCELTPDDEGDWVLFLTDAGARDPGQPYRAHIRQLSETKKSVPTLVWEEYLRLIEALRTREQVETGGGTKPVDFEYQPPKSHAESFELGNSHTPCDLLRPGQPVWVRIDEGTINLVQLAMLWRHSGGTCSAGKRAPEFCPCQQESALCPSCRLFGSAEDAAEDDGPAPARQHSYRGHVRFSDAVASDDFSGDGVRVVLPPMSQPRPGAGQAYLARQDNWEDKAGTPPLREWGSQADAPESRRLRGRKRYWPTSAATVKGRDRAKAREHQLDSNMCSTAHLFPENTKFTATVTFTDIDEAQLGSLLVTLEPRLLSELRNKNRNKKKSPLHQQFGGGRPLGYGSCITRVCRETSEVWYSGARYGGVGDPVSLNKPEEFIDAFRQATADAAKSTWELLGKTLRLNVVDPNFVWYPPGAPWGGDPKKFDAGFDFWQATSGTELGKNNGVPEYYAFTQFPDLAAEDQTMPIIADALDAKRSVQEDQTAGENERADDSGGSHP